MTTTIGKRFFFSLLLTACASLGFAAESEKIVQLTPPVFETNTILKDVDCIRPMREGRFNISKETFQGKKGSKVIVNCFGHGGSGWTTLFGSVGKAVRLFQEGNPDKSKPIRVIGSGCMGFTAAIELTRLGYKVSGITTRSLYDIPSWRAAGYFALVSVKTSPEEQENLNEIGMETFLTYQKIDKGAHPYLKKDTVRYLPVFCSKDTESGVEDLEARGLIPPHEDVTLDFGNGVLHPHFVKYMTYFMDTTKLMRQLTAEVERLKLPIEMKEIKSFDDVQEEVVFNCSGLGGRELCNDDKMIAVRGHLLVLNEESGTEHMDYMIYSKVYQNGGVEYIYMFPKTGVVDSSSPQGISCKGVLGGTFIPHTDKLSKEELAKLDEVEFQKLRDRTKMFFYGEQFQAN